MSEQTSNNEKKQEKCFCTKKLVALEKTIKELKAELEEQKHTIDLLIKVLKRR